GIKVNLANKLILPAKTEVSVSTLAFQHNPNMCIVKETNNNGIAFLPFDLGPRFCVGSNFAITEDKITLVMILQRFQLTLSPVYIHSPLHRLTTRPQHGLQIILHAL
ncbi:hypothetical protein MKX03_036516, partial [Papaver bracteatum]